MWNILFTRQHQQEYLLQSSAPGWILWWEYCSSSLCQTCASLCARRTQSNKTNDLIGWNGETFVFASKNICVQQHFLFCKAPNTKSKIAILLFWSQTVPLPETSSTSPVKTEWLVQIKFPFGMAYFQGLWLLVSPEVCAPSCSFIKESQALHAGVSWSTGKLEMRKKGGVHPWRLTWNIIMEVWFRSFSFLHGWFEVPC